VFVMVKVELGKRDFVWIGILIVLVGVGFGYAYNSGLNPSEMGHSGEELMLDGNTTVSNEFCEKIMGAGHGCGYDNDISASDCPTDQFMDGDGDCWTADSIGGGGSGTSLAGCDAQSVNWLVSGVTGCGAFAPALSHMGTVSLASVGQCSTGVGTFQCTDGTLNFVSGSCGATGACSA
jgi:hypothetical protein